MKIFEEMEIKASEIATIVVFSILGFFIYVLSQDGTVKQKLNGAFLGLFMALAFAYPIYIAMGSDKWWVLSLLSSILAISGQFVPELLQIATRKFAKRWLKEKHGIDADDDN